MDKLIDKVEIMMTDGTKKVMGGGMNDKLFARLAPSQHWASYKIIQVVEHFEITDHDREMMDYDKSHAAVIKAMSY